MNANQKESRKKKVKIKLECTTCLRVFSNKFNLQRHIKRIHELGSYLKENLCQHCGSTFTTSDNLQRHIFNIHQSKRNRRKRNNNTKCPLCDYVNSRKPLLTHLAETHKVDVSVEKLSFKDFKAFEQWKLEFEKQTTSSYIRSHSKKQKNKTIHFYRCHRDGFHKGKMNRIRNLKTLGSNKINGHCPARIDVTLSENKEILVNLMKTHLGHDMEIRRLTLTKTEKENITEQLLLKTPFDTIIKNMKAKYNSERLQLLTKKDIFNISQKLNLKTVHFSELKNWVEENRTTVRYFKRPGESDSTYSLSVKDFLLVTMNDIQIDLIKRFGKHFICIDRLNKSTNLNLGIFVYVDIIKELIPCALVFGNRTDSVIMKIVFEIIKNNCGQVKCEIFMSDIPDSLQFYDAWCEVNGLVTYYLFCPWRVEETFKTSVAKLVEDKSVGSKLSKKLCSLLKCKEISDFEIKLEGIKQYLSTFLLVKYQEYFASMFENSRYCWANCYISDIKSRMEGIIEANRRYGRTAIKAVKQVDGIVNGLMKLSRDKLFSSKFPYLSGSAEKNFDSVEMHKINPDFFIIQEMENKWVLTKLGEEYVVEKNSVQCFCSLWCSYCNICWHSFICSCYDSSIRWKMCQHIHQVGMYLKTSQDIVVVLHEDNQEKSDKNHLGPMNPIQGNLNLNRVETVQKVFKSDLINEFSKEIKDLRTKEEYEVVKKLVSFIGPALEAVRQNEASLNSLTLYF